MPRTAAWLGMLTSLATLSCTTTVYPGLANAPALGTNPSAEASVHDAVANGREACGRGLGPGPLRSQVPACPGVERSRGDSTTANRPPDASGIRHALGRALLLARALLCAGKRGAPFDARPHRVALCTVGAGVERNDLRLAAVGVTGQTGEPSTWKFSRRLTENLRGDERARAAHGPDVGAKSAAERLSGTGTALASIESCGGHSHESRRSISRSRALGPCPGCVRSLHGRPYSGATLRRGVGLPEGWRALSLRRAMLHRALLRRYRMQRMNA